MFAKIVEVFLLEDATPADSELGLGHSPDAIGVLNAIGLDPDYFAYVFES